MNVLQLRTATMEAQRKLGELDGQRSSVAAELRVLKCQLERAHLQSRGSSGALPDAASASSSDQPAMKHPGASPAGHVPKGAPPAPATKAAARMAIQPPLPLGAPAGADAPAAAAAPGDGHVLPPRLRQPRMMPRGVCPRCSARAHKMSGYRHTYVPPCAAPRRQPGRAPSASGSD